jgi:exonuclease-1
MAYLVKEGIADFAVTEDSDLIVYGCPTVVTKLSLMGSGQIYSHEVFKNK